MKNKGFTLIELLVTIALLGVIAIISFVSINKVIEKNKINECITEVDSIKIAASEYVSDNRYKNNFNPDNLRYINLDSSVLIDGNYLKEGSIYEPGSKKELNLNEIGISVKLNDDYTPDGMDVYYIENGDKKLCDCKNTVESEVDNNAPTMIVNVKNGATYEKSKVATVTLHDAGAGLKKGIYKIKYGWGTSSISCSSMSNYVNVDISEEGVISKSVDITIDEKTGAGKIYICNNTAISDVLGNKINSKTVVNDSMYLDNTGPAAIHTLSLNDSTNKFNSEITNLNDSNSGGASIVGYYIGKNISECSTDDSKYNLSTNTSFEHSNTYSGTKWAACVKLKDRLGNVSYIRTPYENFDVLISKYQTVNIDNIDVDGSGYKIKYASGLRNSSYFLNSGTDITSSKKFTVSNSNIYTVAIVNSSKTIIKKAYIYNFPSISSSYSNGIDRSANSSVSGISSMIGKPFTHDSNATVSASLSGNSLTLNISGGDYYDSDYYSQFYCYSGSKACPNGGSLNYFSGMCTGSDMDVEIWYHDLHYSCNGGVVTGSYAGGNNPCPTGYWKDWGELRDQWTVVEGDACPDGDAQITNGVISDGAPFYRQCKWIGDYACSGDSYDVYDYYYRHTVGVIVE